MMKKINFLVLFLSIVFVANGQTRQQADIQIPAMMVNCNDPGRITAKITVKNNDDRDARHTILLVLLPVEVKTISFPKNCWVLNTTVPAPTPWAGCLQCRLGTLEGNKEITIAVTTTRSAHSNRFGVFAYSETADPNPGNNYKEETAICQ
jgi:hypothetical protein